MTGAYQDLRVLDVPIARVCTLIGRSRATHYRHLRAPVQGPASSPPCRTTVKRCTPPSAPGC
jgi:hypothetical protein